MPQSARPVDTVSEYVAANRDELLRALLDYISQPSISVSGEGVAEAAELAAELMRAAGLDPQILPTPGAPLVVGRAPGPPDSPHVLIYGHYDVQPPGPLEQWISPPFGPEVRGGRVYGRGSGDNKGQHLAHLLALRILTETADGPPCPVTVILDGDEEVGSPHLAWAAAEYRDMFSADLALWSDGPVHDSGRAIVALGVRGVVTFEVRVRGPKQAMHSGNWGGVAPNPAWRLVELMSSMRDPTGRVLIEGFYDDVWELTSAERRELESLPVDLGGIIATLGTSALESPADRGLAERLAAWPVLSINSLSCDDANDHRTVIPSVAIARCDVRLVEGQRTARVCELIRAHIARVAPDAEFLAGHGMEPSRTRLDTPYLSAVLAGTAEGSGEEPLIVPSLGGSLPLGVFTGLLGLPCYGVPFANVDEANHAPNENFELRRFYNGIVTSAAILTSLAQHERQPDTQS